MRKSKLKQMEEFRQRVNNSQEPICPLCDRSIPKSQQDEHHLIPKSKKGRETKTLHRACHRQIHAILSEKELATKYSSPEELLSHPEIKKFVDWIKNKPNDFLPSTKASVKRRRELNYK